MSDERVPSSFLHPDLPSLPFNPQDLFTECNRDSSTPKSHVPASQQQQLMLGGSCDSTVNTRISTLRKGNKGFYVVNGHSFQGADIDGNSTGTIAAKAFRKSGAPMQLEHGNMSSSLSFSPLPPQPARQRSHSHSHGAAAAAAGAKRPRSGSDSVGHLSGLAGEGFGESELPYQLGYDGVVGVQRNAAYPPTTTVDHSSIIEGSNFSDIVQHSFFRDVMDSRRDTSITLCESLLPSAQTNRTTLLFGDANASAAEATVLSPSPPRPHPPPPPPPPAPMQVSTRNHLQPQLFSTISFSSTNTQSSNYVRIVRRNRIPALVEASSKKPRNALLRLFSLAPNKAQAISHAPRPSRPSWITGTFVIDPALRVPGGILLPETRDGGVVGDCGAASVAGTLNKVDEGKRNLLLEVENGGIDVFIRLVPQSGLASSSKKKKTKNTKCTTIKLWLRGNGEEMGFSNISDIQKPTRKSSFEESNKADVCFPLIARIAAPRPRPPMHLFASTVPQGSFLQKTRSNNPSCDVRPFLDETAPVGLSRTSTTMATRRPSKSTTARPYHLPSSLVASPQEPPPFERSRVSLKPRLHHHHQTTSSFTAPSSSSASSPLLLPASPIALHLPTTFRGPLTVNVLDVVEHGGVGAHVNLSGDVQRQAVLLQETDNQQVYFIGGLKEDQDEQDEDEVDERERKRERERKGQGEELKRQVVQTRQQPERRKELECEPENMSESESRSVSGLDGGGTTRVNGTRAGSQNHEQDNTDTDTDTDIDTDTPACVAAGSANAFSPSAATAAAAAAATAATTTTTTTMWRGDRIDLVVGRGLVELRFCSE